MSQNKSEIQEEIKMKRVDYTQERNEGKENVVSCFQPFTSQGTQERKYKTLSNKNYLVR